MAVSLSAKFSVGQATRTSWPWPRQARSSPLVLTTVTGAQTPAIRSRNRLGSIGVASSHRNLQADVLRNANKYMCYNNNPQSRDRAPGADDAVGFKNATLAIENIHHHHHHQI